MSSQFKAKEENLNYRLEEAYEHLAKDKNIIEDLKLEIGNLL